MNYETQFRKIEKAYLEHKLSVECPHCNFVGNLLNNNPDWVLVVEEYEVIEGQIVPLMSTNMDSLSKGLFAIENEGNMFYEMKDILDLERKWRTYWNYMMSRKVQREEALYRTLTVTLSLLKEIYVRKGQAAGYILLCKREPDQKLKIISNLAGQDSPLSLDQKQKIGLFNYNNYSKNER